MSYAPTAVFAYQFLTIQSYGFTGRMRVSLQDPTKGICLPAVCDRRARCFASQPTIRHGLRGSTFYL